MIVYYYVLFSTELNKYIDEGFDFISNYKRAITFDSREEATRWLDENTQLGHIAPDGDWTTREFFKNKKDL